MNRYILVSALLTVFFGQSVPAQNFDVYFGILHSHTSFSDGLGTPNEAYQSAREAGLDFMAITEHNHSQAAGSDGIFLTPTNYLILRQSAASHTSADFVAIFGQEVSSISKGNHVNVFFADEICDVPNGDFKNLYETWLPAHPEVPFIQMNHPNAFGDQSSSTPNDYGIDDYGQEFVKLLQFPLWTLFDYNRRVSPFLYVERCAS